MINKQIALTLVFLGAITSVNAHSNDRQTDEPLLVHNSSTSPLMLEDPLIRTVSAIESRELREHYSKKINSALTEKLNAILELPSTTIADNN